MLIGCRETLVRVRARGLVGYDVALTRRRSPVRIRPGPFIFSQTFFKERYFSIFRRLYVVLAAGSIVSCQFPNPTGKINARFHI